MVGSARRSEMDGTVTSKIKKTVILKCKGSFKLPFTFYFHFTLGATELREGPVGLMECSNDDRYVIKLEYWLV